MRRPHAQEVDAAWDDLYEAGPVAPPPPMTPRRQRRRTFLALFFALALLAGGGAGLAAWRVLSAAQALFAAIEAPERHRLEGRVGWDSLQATLERDLRGITNEIQGDQASRYLSGLVQATVAAERQPAALARTIRSRALAAGGGSLAEAMGPVSLEGHVARVDFPAVPGAVASGIGLCLRLRWPALNELRLDALAWPEPGTHCPP